jgi:hypothetical protein
MNPEVQSWNTIRYNDAVDPEEQLMTLEGTVVNGVIVLNGGAALPEGARVRIELEVDDDLGNLPLPPPTAETYEEHLANLRQSIQDTKDGRGRPLEEVMAEIAKEFNLPPVKRG